MNPSFKAHKVVDVLPVALLTDSIYYVRTTFGIDIYVTDHVSPIARPMRQSRLTGHYTQLNNNTGFTLRKGTSVYSTDGINFLPADCTSANSKKIVGMLLYDSNNGDVGVIIQLGGIMEYLPAPVGVLR